MQYLLTSLAIIGAVTFLAGGSSAAPVAEQTKTPEETLARLAAFAALPGPVIVQTFPAVSSATATPASLAFSVLDHIVAETSQTASTVNSDISSASSTSHVDVPYTLADFAKEVYRFMDMTLNLGWVWVKNPNNTISYVWVPNPSNETAPTPTPTLIEVPTKGRELEFRYHPFRLPFFHRGANHTTSLNITSINVTSRPWWRPHFVVFPHSRNATTTTSKVTITFEDLNALPQAQASIDPMKEHEKRRLREHKNSPIEPHQTSEGLVITSSGSVDELIKYRDHLTQEIHLVISKTKKKNLRTEREVIDQLLLKMNPTVFVEIMGPDGGRALYRADPTATITLHAHSRSPAPTPAPDHMKREVAASEENSSVLALQDMSEDELKVYLRHLTLNFVTTQYMHQLGLFKPADHISLNGTAGYNSTATPQSQTVYFMRLPEEVVLQMQKLVQAKNATSLPVSNAYFKRQLFNAEESHMHSFPLQLHNTPTGLTVTSTGSRGDLENYIKTLDCYISRNDKKGIWNHPVEGAWLKYTPQRWRTQAEIYKADQEFERAIAMEMLKHVPQPVVTTLTGLNGGVATLSELPTAVYTVPLDHLLYPLTSNDATAVPSATATSDSVPTS